MRKGSRFDDLFLAEFFAGIELLAGWIVSAPLSAGKCGAGFETLRG